MRPRRLFTFGRQGEGACLKKDGNQGQGAYFFSKNQQSVQNKALNEYLFEKDKKIFVVPTSFKEQRAKQTRQTFYSFERTVF